MLLCALTDRSMSLQSMQILLPTQLTAWWPVLQLTAILRRRMAAAGEQMHAPLHTACSSAGCIQLVTERR